MKRIYDVLFQHPGLLVILLLATLQLPAATYIVAPSGGDFATVQDGIDAAMPGDTVLVRQGTYFEKVSFFRNGNAASGYISLLAWPGERPVLDGTGVSGDNMIEFYDISYTRVAGFEIRNNLNVNDGSGIRIEGSGSFLEIRDNIIHDMRGVDAMGITVYGTESSPISHLVIDNNEIYDCEPARSEALVLNGNVTDFAVTGNLVRDVNNIGIDFIGGETDINPDPMLVVRNGVCRWNTVLRSKSNYGGGYAAGIYVDGARDMVIENNTVSGCDQGIEIGAENGGTITSGIVVRNNAIFANEKVGIKFGGYEEFTGRVAQCEFYNNVCYKNDILAVGNGELSLQYCDDNIVRNNIFYCTDQNILVSSDTANTNTLMDYNLWFCDAGNSSAEFYWNDVYYGGLTDFQNGTGQDMHSLFDDPQLVNPAGGDLHIAAASPARDGGDPAYVPVPGEVDIDNQPRLSGGRVDIGADEVQVTGIADGSSAAPDGFYLSAAYPNPFNPTTNVAFGIRNSEWVTLTVYDLLGREVRSLVNEKMPPGSYVAQWDGKDDSGRPLASGVYMFRVHTKSFSAARKIMLMK